ncbi:MAG: glycosyltransferase family 4 protein [Corynebacterium sp.]|uniref:glycosyltransferase family 4 protein n=1 Tax=unclassified Corynebacterium TaxID=2624378 RepID=UPI000A937538|nr:MULTISPECIES: glycosyltransferase family 4 protein [unclassified Corynebacterium]MDU1461390.1 glycosyltransferase family 4 protein [Corynebacterium sp.]MDU7101884.1 glycosyltransferase family 4 protein [Corynebacterium sp.]
MQHESSKSPVGGGGDVSLRLLVICNAYPSEDNLYRNGFIHRRVKGYLGAGLAVDVFYNHQPVDVAYEYCFDGVHVTVGNDKALARLAAEDDYDAYLVHFAEPHRVDPVLSSGVQAPVIVWVHGFEAEAWHRRWFNFILEPNKVQQALDKKDQYYQRQNAWFAELVASRDTRLRFVNVSRWFQRVVVEPDIGVDFTRSVVIPNVIDSDVFPYRVKRPELRKNILLIRPFASYKYANDQAIEAICELASAPFFEDLKFTICGDGKYFEHQTSPLRNMPNVTLKKGFWDQRHISELHSKNGIFLTPTRFDSQGVSMGEAMSSGLVPVATDIAAIPEFVTDLESGILTAPEEPKSIAAAIEQLYFDPELFCRLSENAAARVRRQCGSDATIGREIKLITDAVRSERNL